MRVGTDIVETAKIIHAITVGGIYFYNRVYTLQECQCINPDNPDYERAAGFWAAKEAAVKALGTGFRDGIGLQDIEIIHDTLGCPHFKFTGRAKQILAEKCIEQTTLSISHCRTHAVATVIFY